MAMKSFASIFSAGFLLLALLALAVSGDFFFDFRLSRAFIAGLLQEIFTPTSVAFFGEVQDFVASLSDFYTRELLLQVNDPLLI